MSLAPYVHLDVPLGEAQTGEEVALPAAAQHHLGRVLRLSVGASLVVADGRGSEAPATWTGTGVEVSATPVTTPPPTPLLEVVQAMGKGRKVDEVVRQVTELGADRIRAVTSRRSIVRLDARKAQAAQERWAQVAWAACEQSRRPRRPSVEAPQDVRAWLAAASPAVAGTILFAHPGGVPLPTVVDEILDADVAGPIPAVLSIAVGPEGGWDDDEVTAATAAGARVVGLGPTVMRTEHAAAAALAVIGARCGRWTSRRPGVPDAR